MRRSQWEPMAVPRNGGGVRSSWLSWRWRCALLWLRSADPARFLGLDFDTWSWLLVAWAVIVLVVARALFG